MVPHALRMPHGWHWWGALECSCPCFEERSAACPAPFNLTVQDIAWGENPGRTPVAGWLQQAPGAAVGPSAEEDAGAVAAWAQGPGPALPPPAARTAPCFLPRFRKRQLDRARQKKEARAADRLEQELLRDTVKFGEVVLQPPALTAKPRRSESGDQPGKKSLMLKRLLSPGGAPQPLTTSMARQRLLEEERERAVQAYRALKQQQQQQQQQQQRQQRARPPRRAPRTAETRP